MQLQADQPGMFSIAAADLVDFGLGQAFRKAVIEDPKFQALRKSALAVEPLFDFLYLHRHNHLWPLCPSPVSRILNADGRTRDARLAPVLTAAVKLDALCLTFGDMFRNGELPAIGEAVDRVDKRGGSRYRISPEIWAQEKFYFHDQTGDIFEEVLSSSDPKKRWVKRWTDVMTRAKAAEPQATVASLENKEPSRWERLQKFNWGLLGR
jgi:hypothetical protein